MFALSNIRVVWVVIAMDLQQRSLFVSLAISGAISLAVTPAARVLALPDQPDAEQGPVALVPDATSSLPSLPHVLTLTGTQVRAFQPEFLPPEAADIPEFTADLQPSSLGDPSLPSFSGDSGDQDQARSLLLAQAPALPGNPTLPTIPQADPNRDRFPQPLPSQGPEEEEREPVLETPETPQRLPAPGSGARVFIRKIEVAGSSVYSDEQLQAIVGAYEGGDLSLEELQEAADAVTQLYLNDGYITSRAVLVDQEIIDGLVLLQIVEGSLEEIEIEGTYRLSQNYIRSRIELGAGKPLRTDRLEDQLRLLRVDPNIANIEASLRASDKIGQSVLAVRITEANNVGGFLGTDNFTPESVGGQRTRAEIYYRNLLGNGETLIGSWDRTYIGGSDVFRITYRHPVNARNGTVQAQVTVDRNEITQPPFDRFDISGETERYDLSFRQPLIRNPRQEFALSLGITHQEGQTLVSNVGTRIGTTTGARGNGTTRITILKFGQDYVRRDPQGAWAFQSQFSFGTNWFGAVENEGNIPDSQFISWLGQGQRVQRINDRHLLIVQADLQLASDELLSSQQFVIGGGQSIRGYRQNARAADNGFRFSIEDRITVRRDEAGRALLQLAPFADAGIVWNNGDNPNTLPDDTFLAALGMGILWQPVSQLDIRFDMGIPLVDIPDEGRDSFQSRGLYFNVNYRYP